MAGASWRIWIAVAVTALAPLAATALMTPRPAPVDGPLELTVGERHALVTQASDRAHVVPADLADVTRLGPRSVVLTPRQAGAGRLVLGDGTRTWDVPLDVNPRVIEALKDEAPEPIGDVQQAPAPFRLGHPRPRALPRHLRP